MAEPTKFTSPRNDDRPCNADGPCNADDVSADGPRNADDVSADCPRDADALLRADRLRKADGPRQPANLTDTGDVIIRKRHHFRLAIGHERPYSPESGRKSARSDQIKALRSDKPGKSGFFRKITFVRSET